ncbi:MAG: FmdB family zinc ribbon protein [Planctomycetota bacterium]
MPTYEYVCNECDHLFEKFQSMSDDPVEECPKCKGNVRRLISGGAGLVFKGSGFYITDSRNDSGGCEQSESCEDGSCPMSDE